MKKINPILKNKIMILLLFLFMTVSAVLPLNGFAAVINPGLASLQAYSTSITATAITLRAQANTENVTLEWNAITHPKGVFGYYVYRSTTSGGQTSLPETDFWITGTSYVDAKVVPGTTYYYIVKPVLGDRSIGASSNQVDIYYQKSTQSITLQAVVNAGNITLQWNSITDPKGVVGYYVYRSTTSGGQTNLPETDFWTTSTSYVDTKVVPGTTYYYIVKPVLGDRSLGSSSNEVVVLHQRIYGTIAMTIGNAIMLANGKLMEIDPGVNTVPVLKDARTMLPIRAVIEAMGGTVDYTASQQKITVKWQSKTVLMWIGSKTIQVDGVQKTIDVAPYYSDTGRTMIPMRFVVENLGCSIDWDGATRTATISYLLVGDGYYPPTPSEDPIPNNIWSGLWFTDRGKLNIVQNGIYIHGTYGDGNTIEGVLSGSKLIGTYNERGTKGDYEFVISSDGKKFDGKFGYKNKQRKHWEDWDGKREEDTFNKYLRQLSSPCNFTGIWSTGVGRLHISQSGNQVTATIGDNGTINGTVANNKLTGTYQKGRESYQIEIYMFENNKNIIGHYGNGDIAKQDWKEFEGEKRSDYYYDDEDDDD